MMLKCIKCQGRIRMKIAIITTMQYPCTPELGWGAESYMWDLAECLDKLGHEVILFAKNGSQCPDHGGLIICDNEPLVFAHIDVLKKMDIVHDFSATKVVHDYCQTHEIKSIATNFNTHFFYPKIHRNLCVVSDRQRYLGLQGRSGFEGTPWEKQVGPTGYLRDARRIYLGLDTQKYTPCYEKEDYILHFNSYDFYKGIGVTLNIAKELPDIKFKIAGSIQYPAHKQVFDQVKPMMDELPNVEYFTDVDNNTKIKLFQKAKAYLFPVMFEQPFAFVVLQAIACGTPVISVNWGAMPEIIRHRETGILCNTQDELKIYTSLLAKSDEKYTNIYENCRKDVVERFDRMTMTKNYIKSYNDVINGDNW